MASRDDHTRVIIGPLAMESDAAVVIARGRWHKQGLGEGGKPYLRRLRGGGGIIIIIASNAASPCLEEEALLCRERLLLLLLQAQQHFIPTYMMTV